MTYRFQFPCKRCGSILEGHTGLSGQPARCPTCHAEIRIPTFDLHTGTVGESEVLSQEPHETGASQGPGASGRRRLEIVRNPEGIEIVRCPRCAGESPRLANRCDRCGLPFTSEGIIPPPPPGGRSGYAVASLVMGLLGLPCFALVLPQVLAIAFGIAAHWRFARSDSARTGRGLATAGLMCGLVSLVFTAVAFVVRWRS